MIALTWVPRAVRVTHGKQNAGSQDLEEGGLGSSWSVGVGFLFEKMKNFRRWVVGMAVQRGCT